MINYFKHHIEYKENSDPTPVFKKLIALIWKNKFTSTGKFLLARMIYSDALIVLVQEEACMLLEFSVLLRKSC